MLSILIPVYNINVTKLVVNLQLQCTKANINFEILCYDDDSRDSVKNKNKPISQLFGVSYVELNENKGRAGIRNALARYSNHPYLLFIDADSKLPNKSFIKNYLPYLRQDTVIYGGRSYVKRKPKSKSKIFHWTYGTSREALPAKKRNKRKYMRFMSNNFIVPRKIFESILFDAKHDGYGYEDTIFATKLSEQKIPILHIDNPLIHTGIENVEVFFNKTKNALDNLIISYHKKEILDTRLILFYKNLQKFGLDKTTYRFLDKRIEKFEENLFGTGPTMRYFDLWKLHYFIKHVQSK
jgi:glycosyltransferase involved in cell wall biosynthesis